MEEPAYQEALHQVNSMLQGFDDLDAPSRRLDVLRTPGPADAFPAAALDSPPRPPPSAVAAAQAPATEDTIRRKKPPSPPLYAWESRTAPGAPRLESIETHAGTFEATATPGLYAAADIDDDDGERVGVWCAPEVAPVKVSCGERLPGDRRAVSTAGGVREDLVEICRPVPV